MSCKNKSSAGRLDLSQQLQKKVFWSFLVTSNYGVLWFVRVEQVYILSLYLKTVFCVCKGGGMAVELPAAATVTGGLSKNSFLLFFKRVLYQMTAL